MFVPFYAGSAVETYLGAGFVTTSILAGVLWFLASIVLGLRIGSWWALLLAVFAGPFGYLGTTVILRNVGELGDAIGQIWAMAGLIWLVGIPFGVLMRKATRLRDFSW